MGKQQKVTILSGQTLWESLNAQGITIPRSCGGKGICQSCQVEIKGVGRVKSCEFTQEGTYEVILPMEEEFSVVGQEVSVSQENFPAKALLIAIDLGTTTVAIKAITTEGEKAEAFINPQRIYGADVMTRIDASTHGLQEKMKGVIKSKLNNVVGTLIKEERFGKEKQVTVVVSGNTTMLHLLRGLSCEGLGKAPFVPVELGMKQENWVVAGKDCKVIYLPGISAFVGGDIVSGLYGLNLWHRKENSFFLDLGTNGEMALIKEGRIWVASAAAGPAFEGTPLALKLRAAGIINLLHFMWEENIIDEYGTLVMHILRKVTRLNYIYPSFRQMKENIFGTKRDW